ncbi:MAG TPA: hypothetical protein VHQ45_09060 [Gemmatimonadaceae bacterium]|jgi:hypothetical protein|nr:hypothetical protein [Gemmatimonadaceae bacterium]
MTHASYGPNAVTSWRRRTGALALATLTVASGCHSYTVMPVTELTPGTSVRVELTDRGRLDLAAVLGPRARGVDGRVTQRTDSAVVLNVEMVLRENGVEEGWLGEPVTLPQSAIAQVQREQVSGARSGLIAGGLVAAVALVAVAFGSDGKGATGQRPGPGEPPGSK